MTDTGKVYKKDWWQREAFKKFVPTILKHTVPSEVHNILDLGCGNGIVTSYLAEIFPSAKILGIDANKQMVESAKQNCINQNINIKHRDIRELDDLCEQSTKYDLINANYVLHWLSLEEKEHLFDILNKIASQNSTILIGTCQCFPNMLQIIDDYICKYFNLPLNYSSIFHYMTSKEWKIFLQKFMFETKDTHENLDIHPVLLSNDISSSDNFLHSWLWGASAGKAAYGHSPNDFAQSVVDELVANLVKMYGTKKYYRNDENNTEGKLTAAFLEETLLLLAQKRK